MKAVVCKAFGPPETLAFEDVEATCARARQRPHCRACDGRELSRSPADRRQVSGQAALPLQPRPRMRRHRHRVRGGGGGARAGHPGAGLHVLRRYGRGGGGAGGMRHPDPRCHAVRCRSGLPRGLRHQLPRAGRARGSGRGRDAAGARRFGRGRALCGGDRQAARRNGDRGRRQRREAGTGARPRRRSLSSTTAPRTCASGSRP